MIPGISSALDASLSFVQGDQWGGIPSLAILVSGSPPADDVASAKMQFWLLGQATPVLTLTTDDSRITIVSASGWTFAIPSQDLPELNANTYSWGFQTTDVNGVIQTYLKGKITVLPPEVT